MVPKASVHRTALFFQLRDLRCGGAVLIYRGEAAGRTARNDWRKTYFEAGRNIMEDTRKRKKRIRKADSVQEASRSNIELERFFDLSTTSIYWFSPTEELLRSGAPTTSDGQFITRVYYV